MNHELNKFVVEEISQFVRSGPLMTPAAAPSASQFRVVNDSRRARFLAWDAVYGAEQLSWTDIREREMSGIKARTYSIAGITELTAETACKTVEFTKVLRRRLGTEDKDLLDDITADLVNCAFIRAAFGIQDNFFERLFAAYKTGGWPCGWLGEYPSGSIAAYFPPTQTHP